MREFKFELTKQELEYVKLSIREVFEQEDLSYLDFESLDKEELLEVYNNFSICDYDSLYEIEYNLLYDIFGDLVKSRNLDIVNDIENDIYDFDDLMETYINESIFDDFKNEVLLDISGLIINEIVGDYIESLGVLTKSMIEFNESSTKIVEFVKVKDIKSNQDFYCLRDYTLETNYFGTTKVEGLSYLINDYFESITFIGDWIGSGGLVPIFSLQNHKYERDNNTKLVDLELISSFEVDYKLIKEIRKQFGIL